MKNFLKAFCLFSFLLVWQVSVKAQTVTTIDYAYKTFTTTCNIFATNVSVNSLDHLTTLGRPKYDDNSVLLECKPNNNSTLLTTLYSVRYNFKSGYTYAIKVYCKGETKSPDVVYPSVALTLSTTNGGNDAGTNCTTPSSFSKTTAASFAHGRSGSSYAWVNISNNKISQSYDYLIIGAFNDDIGNVETGKIYVRKIEITETAPRFTLAPSPSVDVPLNSTPAKTFTVTNVDNASGATYEWNLGASNGWLYNGSAAPATFTASNSITLTPASNCTSLSNVSVNVKLNGTSLQTLNCTITRSAPTNISVTASQQDCNTVIFTATNPSNLSSYNWSLSGDLNVGGLTTVTTTSNTITATGSSGQVYLEGAGNCSTTLTGGILYGPYERQISGLYPEYIPNDHVSVSVNTTTSDTYYRWYVNNTLVKEGSDAYSYCTCSNEPPDARVCGENTISVEVETNCNITTSSNVEYFQKICGYYRLGKGKSETTLATQSVTKDKVSISKLAIYPNPVNNQLNISLPDSINTLKATIQLIDIYGKVVKKITTVSKSNTIPMSSLPSGMYLVEIYDGTNKITTQKIIKQ